MPLYYMGFGVDEAKNLFDVADKLGLIQAVKRKLIIQQDPASDKLVIVLEEISKIHIAIEKELGEYLGLWFDPSNMHNATKEQEGRKILLDLEGDKIKVRIGKARGSCKTIMNIYNTYLTPWFGRVLNKNEIETMRILFESLHEFDGVMIEAMEKLAVWLGPKATETLEMVDDNMNDKANDLIRSARREVLPIRQRISNSLCEIYKLQEVFIGKSGSV